MNDIKDAFHSIISDEIISSWIIPSSQNHVYGIETNLSKYILKQFSHDTIRDENDLKIKKEQIRISSIWNKHDIPCILPVTDIYFYHDYYYIIYPFFDGTSISCEDLSLEQIHILAKNQAKIHTLSISSFLENHIKRIEIKKNELLFFQDKMDAIVDVSSKYSCMCQNDYKPLNILWKNQQPYMIDFDAVSYNHPTFSLWEALFTYSYRNHEFDVRYFEEYLKAYLEEYKYPLKDLDLAFYGAWNGKIQWVHYLLESRNSDPGIEELSNQMIDSYHKLDFIMQIVSKYL